MGYINNGYLEMLHYKVSYVGVKTPVYGIFYLPEGKVRITKFT